MIYKLSQYSFGTHKTYLACKPHLIHYGDFFWQEKADELVGKMRDTILADNTTAKTRCLLMELLELRACQWNMNPDVERSYSDMLADIMARE